jgi:hypothetical protein
MFYCAYIYFDDDLPLLNSKSKEKNQKKKKPKPKVKFPEQYFLKHTRELADYPVSNAK